MALAKFEKCLDDCLATGVPIPWHPLDCVESAGHLVFVFQGSQAALGWMAFGWSLDHHRMGVIGKIFY